MSKRRSTWKCLAALMVAPLTFACSDGSKTNPGADAAQPRVDALVAADTAIARDGVAGDTAVEVALKPDTPAVDASSPTDGIVSVETGGVVDAAVDAASPTDVPLPSPDAAAGDATSDAMDEEVALGCAIVPAFKGGIVTKDLTLTRACSPYVIDTSIRVEGNAALTIEPGVTMMFKKNTRLTISYNDPGRLVAVGTATQPIVLTSEAASPAGGDWNGIELYGDTMAGNQLGYVTMEYCGRPSSACIIGLSGVTPGALTIDHVTFDHVGAGGNGIQEDGSSLAFKITNTTFKPGAIAPTDFAISMDAGSFEGIGAGNVFNGATINIDGGTVKNTATWINPGTPIVVTSKIRIEGTLSPSLTLSPGTIMQFAADTGIWVGYSGAMAQLVAEGTAAAPIVMTSKANTPGAGDWEGITLWEGTANGTKLAYLKLDYCGANNGGCVNAVGAKADRVTIDHVTIDHVGPKADGISAQVTDAHIKIDNCSFPAGAIQAGQYAISVFAPSFEDIGTNNSFAGALIQLDGGTIGTDTDWTNPGTTVVVTRDIRVEGVSSPVLTVAAGTTFKMGGGTALWIAYGSVGAKLVVNGTATAHVTFTSLSSAPSKGDWNGIVTWGSGQAVLTYADISYAGGYVAGGVAANSDKSVVTMTNSTVSNIKGYGVFIACTNASTYHQVVTLTGCTFSGNDNIDQGPGPICP
jgi:hypothetical protein